MIISFSIKIYTVLVNVAHCYQNLMRLLHAKTPVFFCVDRLPCPEFTFIKVDFVVLSPSMFCYVRTGFKLFDISFMFLFLVSRALPISPI